MPLLSADTAFARPRPISMRFARLSLPALRLQLLGFAPQPMAPTCTWWMLLYQPSSMSRKEPVLPGVSILTVSSTRERLLSMSSSTERRRKGLSMGEVGQGVFLNEPSIVWERLADVDQGAAAFVDGRFRKSSPVGGYWAVYTGESALAVLEGYSQAVVMNPAACE
ncbi:hypothetical protein EW146_g2480 [Bondarzewia mesenterica]|uniref:Uncharacterized protein n=1 Tax=Bondarzewia mesenterica TaxID=1095465 RepID=A0A4S4M0H7_9AGAM|nr:hypothetical protein EW146_g2480 [Bondarzewia mesenterica]